MLTVLVVVVTYPTSFISLIFACKASSISFGYDNIIIVAISLALNGLVIVMITRTDITLMSSACITTINSFLYIVWVIHSVFCDVDVSTSLVRCIWLSCVFYVSTDFVYAGILRACSFCYVNVPTTFYAILMYFVCTHSFHNSRGIVYGPIGFISPPTYFFNVSIACPLVSGLHW